MAKLAPNRPEPKEDPVSAYDGIEPFTGSDDMCFGKHEGEMLDSVPASWFRWLWTQTDFEQEFRDGELTGDRARLAMYIEENWKYIENE